jgi:tetratricopeptide (TPR) repeat protein
MLVMLTPLIRAAEAGAAFDQANRLYEEGQYRDAAEAYQKLITSGTTSAALLFNLGNAEFKAGQIGAAIAAYRRAERLAPRDPDLAANLQFARGQVTGPSRHPNWLQQQLHRLTTNEWTLLAVIPLWAWFALLMVRQLRPALKPRLRTATWSCGALTLLSCGVLAVVVHRRLDEHEVVVTARNTVVRYGPFAESQSAFTAADGAELSLLDHKADWFQVSAGGKTIGWLKTNAVAVLN